MTAKKSTKECAARAICCFSNLHLLLLCRRRRRRHCLSILLTNATDSSCIKIKRKFAASIRIMHPPFMQTWDKLVPNYSEACPGMGINNYELYRNLPLLTLKFHIRLSPKLLSVLSLFAFAAVSEVTATSYSFQQPRCKVWFVQFLSTGTELQVLVSANETFL